MECKHITAMKEPWRHSSHFKALPQMVTTISRLDKLAALHQVFHNHGMLKGMLSQYALAVVAGATPLILPYGTPNINKNASDNDCNGGNDGGPLPGPKTLAQVMLAVTPGECITLEIASTAIITHPYLSEQNYLNTLDVLAAFIKQHGFPTAVQQFVYVQWHPDSL